MADKILKKVFNGKMLFQLAIYERLEFIPLAKVLLTITSSKSRSGNVTNKHTQYTNCKKNVNIIHYPCKEKFFNRLKIYTPNKIHNIQTRIL